MKKMLVMAVAAALCSAALADTGTYGWAYFSNYATVDPNPSSEKTGYYSCYLINSDTVSSAAGLETWLAENGGITRENIAKKGLTITSYKNFVWDGIDQYSLEMNKNESALTTESNYKYAVILAATEKTSEAPDFAYEIMQGVESGNTWNFDDSKGPTPVTWTTAPVPEPTSGILLLLGVAGLALKRKRA